VSSIELREAFSRALYDCKESPVLLLPHLIEYLLDLGLILLGVLSVFVFLGASFGPEVARGLLSGRAPLPPLGSLALLTLFLLSLLLLGAYLNAAARGAVIAMGQELYGGEKTGWRTGLRGAKRFGLSILFFQVLLALLLGSLLLLAFLPLFLLLSSGGGGFLSLFLTVLTLLVAGVSGGALYVATLFTPQGIAAEGRGVLAGARLSLRFVSSNLGKVIGYGVLVFLLFLSLSLFTSLSQRLLPLGGVGRQVYPAVLSVLAGLILSPYLETVKTYLVLGSFTGSSGARPPPPR
jgi:hypothetical protein